MTAPNPFYKEWLRKVEEDEFAGQAILEAGHFAAPACFHFQQMAEKLLKALLLYHNQPFPKIHDVIALATLLKPFVDDIDTIRAELEELARYYIETRYPGDYPEFTLTEGREAQVAAATVKQFVLHKIKS